MAQYLYYAGVLVTAGAEVYNASIEAQNEDARAQQLELEKRAAQIRALDEETERLRELNEVNAEAIANAGSLDPFVSPSLLALRKANLKTAQKDVENIRFNLAVERAGIMAAISIAKRNRKAAIRGGILSALGTLGQGYQQGGSTFGRGGSLG